MKSYREHVADQMAAATAAQARAGVMDESLAGRYLRASSEIEIKAAETFWTKLQNAAGDDQRLAMIVQDRRGSAVDLLLSQLGSLAAFQIGRVVAATAPAAIAGLPGFAAFITALLVKLPYAARAGLQSAANSYNLGVVIEQQKGGKT